MVTPAEEKKEQTTGEEVSTEPEPERKGTARDAPASPAEASTELSRFVPRETASEVGA